MTLKEKTGGVQTVRSSAKVLRAASAVAVVLLVACLAFVMPVSADSVTPVLEGEGTVDNPFKIYDLQNLTDMRNATWGSQWASEYGGSSYSGNIQGDNGITKSATSANYTLMNDIDLAGSETNKWIPIKTVGGIFGNNKKIKNLYVSKADYAGFISGSGSMKTTIKDLTIEDVTIIAEGTSSSGGFGSFIGFVDTGSTITFSNCKVIGDIYIGYSNTKSQEMIQWAGGLVGYTSNTQISISNCKVIGNPGSYIKGDSSCGGLIGQIAASSTGTISNCEVNIDVYGYRSVGGFVGALRASGITIENCVATGSVNFDSTQNKDTGLITIGGFVGEIMAESNNWATIKNSKSTGEITTDYTNAGNNKVYVGFIGGTRGTGSERNDPDDIESLSTSNAIQDCTFELDSETIALLTELSDNNQIDTSTWTIITPEEPLPPTPTPTEEPKDDKPAGSSVWLTGPAYSIYSAHIENGGSAYFSDNSPVSKITIPDTYSGDVTITTYSDAESPAGKNVYLKMEIDAKPALSFGETATIYFKLPLFILQQNGLEAADVCLYHGNGGWTKLPTQYSIVGDIVYYEAQTESFSPFAIVFEENAATAKDAPITPVPTTTETTSPGFGVLAVLAGLGCVLALRKP